MSQHAPRRVATDGGCSPNPGPGGWAWVDQDGRYECGSFASGTNNVAELTALKMALLAHTDIPLEIEYDSQYAVHSVTRWGRTWKEKGLTGKANMDLIFSIMDIIETRPQEAPITWTWVPGHARGAHPLNETADRLAGQMVTKARAGGVHHESGVTTVEPSAKDPHARPVSGKKKKPSSTSTVPSAAASTPIPGHCSQPGCQNTYKDHHWGHKQAATQGWFFQKNGHAWCPEHTPAWVAAWRAGKSSSTS